MISSSTKVTFLSFLILIFSCKKAESPVEEIETTTVDCVNPATLSILNNTDYRLDIYIVSLRKHPFPKKTPKFNVTI